MLLKANAGPELGLNGMTMAEITAQQRGQKAITKQRLLHVAVSLFAEHGIAGTSMRMINLQSGSKNKSALQYYFGSKQGVIEAVFKEVALITEPIYSELAERLQRLRSEQSLTIAEVLLSLYLPLYFVEERGPYGAHFSKLLAKMMLDNNAEYFPLFLRLFGGPTVQSFNYLYEILPDKAQEALRFQLTHSFMATVSGIATRKLMDKTPLGDTRFASEQQLILNYLPFVVGGICSGSSQVNTNEQTQFDALYWAKYLSMADEAQW